MKNVSGITYFREQMTAQPRREHDALINRLRDQCLLALSNLLGSMFDGIDDSFFELANHSHTNNEQNRYFEAMREVRIKRKGIESQFQTLLNQAWRQPAFINRSLSDSRLNEPVSMESLSLVQNDALEESVAISSMVTKARANFTGSLLQFQQRISTLYVNAGEENPVNPLDPEMISRAFAESVADLGIEIREKLIVLKQFDRYVIGNLGDVIEEANKALALAGILPNLKWQARKSRALPRSSTDDAMATSAATTAEDGNDTFLQLQNLLASIRAGAPTGAQSTSPRLKGEGSGPVQMLSTAELMSLLNRLQTVSVQDNLAEGPVMALDLRQALQGILNQESQKTGKSPAVEQVDEDLINLVSMLFEFILDDYNLSAPIQVLISRLQIPILKVALKDKSFFSRPAHPARRLLNALAKAGIGWSDSAEKKKDRLYDHIHRVVQRIITEFNGDLSLFEELYLEFSRILDREEHKAQLVEKRTREAESGRIKSQKAHRVVDELIRQRLEASELPEVARDLIRTGWNRVMFLAYLREETDHRFKHSVRIMDELIWCLHPHGDPQARERWVKIVPQLLKQIKAGLLEISVNSDRLETLLADLKKELTHIFKQQPPAGRDATVPEPAPIAAVERQVGHERQSAKTAVELQGEIESAVLAEFLLRIDEIDIGNWVEFSLVNGSRFRCKLSAKVPEEDTCIFVNRLGLKVVEKTREELAHELRKGRMHILEEGLLIDRAMDAVVGNLRKMSGKAA